MFDHDPSSCRIPLGKAQGNHIEGHALEDLHVQKEVERDRVAAHAHHIIVV